jgi:hypothetical protein
LVLELDLLSFQPINVALELFDPIEQLVYEDGVERTVVHFIGELRSSPYVFQSGGDSGRRRFIVILRRPFRRRLDNLLPFAFLRGWM